MMYAALSQFGRAVAPRALSCSSQRHLSVACAQSVHKLNGILEEYRAKNYSQCFPKRFQKDIVKAVAANSQRQLNVEAVSAEGIEHVLRNIGMGHRMSRSEIDSIISEFSKPLGGERGGSVISADQMLDLISNSWEEHHQDLNQPRL